MLEFLFLLIVLAVAAYVFWDGVRDELPGAPRRLMLAAILAMGGALAVTGSRASTPLVVAAWLLTFALIVASGRATERRRRV